MISQPIIVALGSFSVDSEAACAFFGCIHVPEMFSEGIERVQGNARSGSVSRELFFALLALVAAIPKAIYVRVLATGTTDATFPTVWVFIVCRLVGFQWPIPSAWSVFTDCCYSVQKKLSNTQNPS